MTHHYKGFFLLLFSLLIVISCQKTSPQEEIPMKSGYDSNDTVRVPIGGATLPINNICEINGLLYVVGEFFEIGGVYCNRIATYNGSNLSNYQTDLNTGAIYAMADFNGNNVIGGSYWTSYNGAGYIGSINNSLSSYIYIISTQPKGRILAMESEGSKLYYTGDFKSFSSGSSIYISSPLMELAYYTHTDIGSDLPGKAWSMRTLKKYNNEWYVAGSCSSMGHVLKCTAGTTWSMAGSGFDKEVMELEIVNSTLYAAGYMTKNFSATTSLNYVNKLNGNVWEKVGNSNLPGPCNAIEFHNGKLYAGGNGYLYYLSSSGKWVSCISGNVKIGEVLKLKTYKGELYGIERNSSSNTYAFLKYKV